MTLLQTILINLAIFLLRMFEKEIRVQTAVNEMAAKNAAAKSLSEKMDVAKDIQNRLGD